MDRKHRNLDVGPWPQALLKPWCAPLLIQEKDCREQSLLFFFDCPVFLSVSGAAIAVSCCFLLRVTAAACLVLCCFLGPEPSSRTDSKYVRPGSNATSPLSL
jgi:hypothetical protein